MLFVWHPYEIPVIISCIPRHVREDRAVCSTITALVCFEAVEWHPSNHIMRQFGVYQLIPPDLVNLGEFHNQDLRGKTDWNWIQTHQHWINIWHCRFEHMPHGDLIVDYIAACGSYLCKVVVVCRISPARSMRI